MTLTPPRIEDRTLLFPGDPLPIAFTDQISRLSRGLSPVADGAVWTRALPRAVQNWLDTLPKQQLPQGRVVLPPSKVAACMSELFSGAGHPASPALAWLCVDATRLARCVAEVTGSPLLRLRLEPVFDDACAKFHIDNVVARLICTYRGPGTQVSADPSRADNIRTIPTGMPLLLKGKRWPDGQDAELRHRSPPIAQSGLSRLVLVIEGTSSKDIMPEYDQVFAA